MSRLIIGSILVLTLVAGAIGAVAYAKYQQIQVASTTPPPAEMPVTVAVAPVKSDVYRRSSTVIGTALASRSVTLRNELTGVVTEVATQPGDRVKQGDVLVKFDTQLEEAELKSALATKKLAEDALARNQRLKASGAGSEQLLEQAVADLSKASAEVERLRVLIEKKTLSAPFDAQVGLFDLHTGQYLPAGTEITDLSGVSGQLKVDFAMPQNVATSVGVGDPVELVFAASAAPLVSNIVAIDASANLQSRSLMARTRLTSPPPGLHPGDSVRVRIPYGPELPAIKIPTTAVRRGPTGTTVFVAVDREGVLRAESRGVEVLGNDGSSTWIASGLLPTDTVVTDGSFKVSEGVLLAQGEAL